jgi:hypothetical protein
MRLVLRLLWIHLTFASCLSTLDSCLTEEEGTCRVATTVTDVEVCASGYWQVKPKGPYQCANGTMVPLASRETVTSLQTSLAHHSDWSASKPLSYTSQMTGIFTETPAAKQSSMPQPGDTGNSICQAVPVPAHEDDHGIASYTKGGRMASVYVASDTDAFRCEIEPPADGMYVAVWTRYDPKLPSQPKPKNCGEIVHLTNPKTGVSSDALVLDRCQSCVGVDHQASDPSTCDDWVNGATIDLSVRLWNLLYDSAAYAVYDIDYDGPVYGGSDDGPPDGLTSLYCLPNDNRPHKCDKCNRTCKV